MEIKTEILINTTPDNVWAELIAFENYPIWNSFINSITGTPKVGKKITVSIASPNESHMTFKPTILVFEDNKEFRWLGKLWFRGLFDGEHTFELIDKGNGTTLFKQSETFSGILVYFFQKQLKNSTRKNFELMNHDLKKYVESTMKHPKETEPFT